MDAPRPRNVTREEFEVFQREFESFRRETRETVHSMHETMGKMMRVSTQTHETVVDLKATVERIDRRLYGGTTSQHDLEEVARLAATEATGRHHIPPPGAIPSEPIKKAVDQKWDSSIASVVRQVGLGLVVALSFLVAGMVIRDCQRGNVPTQIGH